MGGMSEDTGGSLDFPPFPGLPIAPNVKGFGRHDKWAFDVGRRFKFSKHHEEEACDEFWSLCESLGISEEDGTYLFASFQKGFKAGTVDPLRLRHAAMAVEFFLRNGEIPIGKKYGRPKGPSARLWLLMCILGFGGREFSFALDAVTRAMDLQWQSTVQGFVRTMVTNQKVDVLRKGCSSGRIPALYRLIDPEMKWCLLDLMPRRSESEEPAVGNRKWKDKWRKYLVQNLPWLEIDRRAAEYKCETRKTLY